MVKKAGWAKDDVTDAHPGRDRVIGGRIAFGAVPPVDNSRPVCEDLFESMRLPAGAGFIIPEGLRPLVHAEIAFVMEKELSGPNLTSADIMAATAYVVPAISIVAARDRGGSAIWFPSDMPEDYLLTQRFKDGGVQVSPASLNLALVGVTVSVNGEDMRFAASGAVLGHPARAVAIYANLLAGLGKRLEAGQIVLSGGITAVPVRAGNRIRAEFGGLGAVELQVG